jgi:hypothetical protein
VWVIFKGIYRLFSMKIIQPLDFVQVRYVACQSVLPLLRKAVISTVS